MNSTPRATMNGKPVRTVPAKTIINFESGFAEKLLCDGPTFSTGTSCVYSCSFCYVGAIMNKNPHVQAAKKEGLNHMDVVIRRARPVDILRAQLTDRHGNPKFKTPTDRRVIYASPLVDVAGNMDLVRETVEACNVILSLTNWQIRLLSKSHLLPKVAEWLEGYVPKWYWEGAEGWKRRVIYGVSTGTLDDRLAAAFEQGTPMVSKRIQSLHWLQDNGFRTFAMVCPSLPQMAGLYGDFARAMYAALNYERCEHVWAEVMNVRGQSLTGTVKALTEAGFPAEAEQLHTVSQCRRAWETYARNTFEAHCKFVPPHKLRFLQYVNKKNLSYWEAARDKGAVLLGKAAHPELQTQCCFGIGAHEIGLGGQRCPRPATWRSTFHGKPGGLAWCDEHIPGSTAPHAVVAIENPHII